jgi:HEAT repeat protein
MIPTAPRRDPVGLDELRALFQEVIYILDYITDTSPSELDKWLADIAPKLTRGNADLFFGAARDSDANAKTLAALSKAALTMLKGDASIDWSDSGIGGFLVDMAKRNPDILLQPDMKRQLHELCGSPAEEVRMGVIDVLGTIRDEEALPILLPKLQGGSPRPGRPGGGTTRLMIGDSFQPSVGPGEPFFWLSREPRCAWQAVKSISGPRTTEFLLEKLQSDDMSWVYTAATLLPSLKDDRAIAPLKKRYSELSASQDDIVRQVVSRIAYAYESLSGRLITEPEEKK